MEKDNLYKQMNIPPRDPTKYPMPNDEDMIEAYNMMYKISLISSCCDDNLKALTLNMYLAISNYLCESGESLTDNGRLECVKSALDNLKEYVSKSKNPIFNKIPEKESFKSQDLFKRLNK